MSKLIQELSDIFNNKKIKKEIIKNEEETTLINFKSKNLIVLLCIMKINEINNWYELIWQQYKISYFFHKKHTIKDVRIKINYMEYKKLISFINEYIN